MSSRAKWLNLAARAIGVFSLMASMLVVIQVTIDVKNIRDNAYNTTFSTDNIDIWINKLNQNQEFWKQEAHLISVGTISFIFGISSFLLIYGTYIKRRFLAVPWLAAEGASIAVQLATLTLQTFQAKSPGGLRETAFMTALLALGITFIMWGVVFEAQRYWQPESWQGIPQVAAPKGLASCSSPDLSSPETPSAWGCPPASLPCPPAPLRPPPQPRHNYHVSVV